MLEKIKIASPCKANWEQMAGDECVRHCAECDLDVYNFSEMPREEVERLVREREGRLCARFYQRPDGTMLTQDCPSSFRARVRLVAGAVGAAIAAAMGVLPAWGQETTPKTPPQQDETGIALHVVNSEGVPVAGAKVRMRKLGRERKEETSVTSTTGDMAFLGLESGVYAFSVSHPEFGFASVLRATQDKSVLKITLTLHGEVMVGMVAPIEDRAFPPSAGSGVVAPAPRAFPRK